MHAVVSISGKQFWVKPGDEVNVPLQDVKPGKKVVYDRVLLVNTGNKVKVGTPVVSNSTIEATVIEHGRGEKITVFKKKRRKKYRVKNSHRQEFTKIRVDSVKERVQKKTSSPKTKAPPVKKTKVREQK